MRYVRSLHHEGGTISGPYTTRKARKFVKELQAMFPWATHEHVSPYDIPKNKRSLRDEAFLFLGIILAAWGAIMLAAYLLTP